MQWRGCWSTFGNVAAGWEIELLDQDMYLTYEAEIYTAGSEAFAAPTAPTTFLMGPRVLVRRW